MSEADGRILVRRMLSGQEEAFEEFFSGFFPGLYRFALARMGGHADGAEDVAQAALCKAISKLATYRGEAALFTWLCTFCRHEIAAWYRRNRPAAHQTEMFEDTPEVRAALESLPASFMEEPGASLDRKEMSRLVQAVLDRLPGRYGDVLEWKYIDDLPVKEIATRLGVSPKAAESMLTRSREAFRDGFASLMPGVRRRGAPV